MVRGFAVLLTMQFLGELLSRWLAMPIPGNVLGMGLLLFLLSTGVVRVEWLEEAAELLLSHMALFFIPAGVGVMVYLDLVRRELRLDALVREVVAQRGRSDGALAGVPRQRRAASARRADRSPLRVSARVRTEAAPRGGQRRHLRTGWHACPDFGAGRQAAHGRRPHATPRAGMPRVNTSCVTMP